MVSNIFDSHSYSGKWSNLIWRAYFSDGFKPATASEWQVKVFESFTSPFAKGFSQQNSVIWIDWEFLQGGSYKWSFTPIRRVITPVTDLFSAIYRVCNSTYNSIRGPPCGFSSYSPQEWWVSSNPPLEPGVFDGNSKPFRAPAFVQVVLVTWGFVFVDVIFYGFYHGKITMFHHRLGEDCFVHFFKHHGQAIQVHGYKGIYLPKLVSSTGGIFSKCIWEEPFPKTSSPSRVIRILDVLNPHNATTHQEIRS